MRSPRLDAIQRLQAVCGLGTALAERAVSEVTDAFDCSVDEFIAQRHRELHARGLSNSEVFELIRAELPELRFRAPALSPRQLRRRIYG